VPGLQESRPSVLRGDTLLIKQKDGYKQYEARVTLVRMAHARTGTGSCSIIAGYEEGWPLALGAQSELGKMKTIFPVRHIRQKYLQQSCGDGVANLVAAPAPSQRNLTFLVEKLKIITKYRYRYILAQNGPLRITGTVKNMKIYATKKCGVKYENARRWNRVRS
jgi:hypothetical protein